MRFLFFLMVLTLFSNNKRVENHKLNLINSNLLSDTINDDCESGKKRALIDIKNNIYILQTLGQVVNKEFDPFFIKYAKEKYNIQITSAPCVIYMEPKCYKETMRAYVLNKFGNDIEFKMKEKAIYEFKKTDYYISNIKPKIDSDSIIKNVHTSAEFSEDYSSVKDFFFKNIKETKMKYWTAYFSIIIEKDGTVTNLEFTKETKPEVKEEVERLVNLMPKWVPATYYKEKVRTKKHLSLSSKKNMEMIAEIRRKKAIKND
jgi:hypothetical protein